MSSPPRQPAASERPTNPLTDRQIRVCPECDGPLARASGCLTCLHCGWGKCG
jgi:ribonucleoside-diphosphate reductase alpha chain